MFVQQPELVNGIYLSMICASLLLLFIGFFGQKIFSLLSLVSLRLIIPSVIFFCAIGSYLQGGGIIGVWLILFFGIFGYILKKLQFDVTPLVMAFILAPSLEYAFGQTLSLGDDNVLMYLLSERPIAALIIVSTPVITWKLFQRSKKLRDVATSLTSSQVKSS